MQVGLRCANRTCCSAARVVVCLLFPPHKSESRLNLFLEAGNQLAVGGDEGLLGFYLGDDLLLGGEGWEGNFDLFQGVPIELRLTSTSH
jgi:hypothetical protein